MLNEYVKAHTDKMDELSIGNRMADQLATESIKNNDIDDNVSEIANEDFTSKHSVITVDNKDISETIIDIDKDADTDMDKKNTDKDADTDDSDDDDEVWIKVKHKKQAYYIVQGENPQYIYSIIDNKKGDRIGHREMVMVNDKKKYKYKFN